MSRRVRLVRAEAVHSGQLVRYRMHFDCGHSRLATYVRSKFREGSIQICRVCETPAIEPVPPRVRALRSTNPKLEQSAWCAHHRIVFSWVGSPRLRDALCPEPECALPLGRKPRPDVIGRHIRKNQTPLTATQETEHGHEAHEA